MRVVKKVKKKTLLYNIIYILYIEYFFIYICIN